MQIEWVRAEALKEDRLPDGSRILVDTSNEKVFALNATAGAAWDACSVPATLKQITIEMQRTLTGDVSEDLAADAVRQLEEQNLVRASGQGTMSTRRAFLGNMGAVAASPVVAALTLTEQRAYARISVSAKPSLHRQPEPFPPPPPKQWSWW
jgi:hypothetical protein